MQNDTSYSNDQIRSYYSFTDADKTVQYFANDGRLIGIRDKFGNTIKFEHTLKNIVNRVPNGCFENGLDMWNTSSSGVTPVYTGRYDDSALRMNSSSFVFAASTAIEVEPSTSYNLSADVFPRYGVNDDIDIEIHLLDAAYNEMSVQRIYVPYNLVANAWDEVTGSFSTSSSTRYVFIAIVAPDGTTQVDFDNICVEKPKPLISKITDSIGREVIFNYQGKIENENAPNDVILTIKKPNGSVAKTITYERTVVSMIAEMRDGTWQTLRAWYLSSSNAEGTNGYPVYYYYGGVTPDTEEYEDLAWKPGFLYNVSTTIKPLINIIQYKNHISMYEYEKVRKGLGRHGYYDTLRVKARYDKYVVSGGIAGEQNRLDYSYYGHCGDYSISNETGYPVTNFNDPDDYSGNMVEFISTATAAFTPNDKLITRNTYRNGRLYSEKSSSSKLYQSVENYYYYHSTFKDSIVFVGNIIQNDVDEVHTYAAMTYNSWGGLETETRLLEADLYDNPLERAKYTTTYTYHALHKKVTSAQCFNEADGDPVTELWDYDSLGRLIKYTNAMGEETEYLYENSTYTGNLTKIKMNDPSNTHYVLGNQIAQTTYTYDQYNAFVASEACNYQGGTSTTLYEYEYLFGNVEKQTNPDGDWWEFEYDENGRLLSEYSPLVQGDGYPFCFVTDYVYPGLYLNPLYTIDPAVVFDVVIKNEYIYNFIDGTYSLKSASQYLYGSEGEGLLLVQFDLDRPVSDGYESITTKYCYDDYTRLAEVIDDGGKSTKAKYDAFGRVEEVTDNAGNKYITEYDPTARTQLSYFVPVTAPSTKENHIKLQCDAFGNLESKYAYPEGYNGVPISAEYRYNIAGKITEYTDPNGNEYSYTYDKMGRLKKTLLPDGTSASANYNKFNTPNFEHQYNADGDATASRATTTDESGNKQLTFYQYNSLLTHSDSFLSDEMGRTTRKNEGGGTYTMQYDGMSNITKLSSGGTDLNYKYGRHGVLKITPSDSTVTAIQYGYNNFGRLYGKAQDGVSTAYQYTTTGQVELSGDTLGMYTEYYYDNLNRVDSVYALNSDYYFDYYDDGMIKTMYSGPLTTTYTYDNLNRVTSIITKHSAISINNLAYTYDKNSNILTETRNGITTTYTYDEMNRLKTANYGDNNTITYYYDARGNRTEESHSTGLIKTYNYNKSNRLKSIEENGIITDEYDYNAAGALISHNNDTYIYDNWDRLSSATISGITHTYKYDANGLRTAKGDKKYIVGTKGNVIAERNGSTTTAQNVYINGQIMSRKIGSQWYFYLKNARGDIIGMADSNGDVVNTYAYDAWGNIRTTETVETIENPIKYAGEYYDSELEQYYLRARYYDPKVGRFTSLDIIRGNISNPQGMNRYVYCVNNPVNYTDSSGLYAESDKDLPSWANDLINGAGGYTDQWWDAYYAGNQAGMNAAHAGAESVRSRAKAVEIALYYDDKTSYENGFHYYDSSVNSSDGSDCTNFISIALNGAGMAMTNEWNWKSYSTGGVRGIFGKSTTDATASWLRPDEFYRYFTSGDRSDGVAYMAKGSDFSTVPGGILPGDVIAYSNFDDVPPGYINHLGIVTSIQGDGIHLSGHTNARTDESLSSILGSSFNGDIYIIRIRY
ncbi:MAG: hypothetical protein GX800_09975 [Clostridiaceae bacterium]|nr:hypothetical protein [Clostridiaceae bacterium]